MKKVYRIDFKNGYYLFKLEQILDEKEISKNKIMKDTNTDFKVLQRIMKGDLDRIDIKVMARLCDYLDCTMEDIVEYKKNSSK